MSLIKIFSTFTFYGIDVSLLAFLTAILTQVIKKTLFRNAQKKLITFLPFILGTVLYAIYATIRYLSITYIFVEYVSVLEYGLSVGALATLYYVLYEQFVRQKDNLTATECVVKTLILEYIPEEAAEKAAKEIVSALSGTSDGEQRTREILKNYSGDEMSDSDIELLAKLIIDTLAHLKTL